MISSFFLQVSHRCFAILLSLFLILLSTLSWVPLKRCQFDKARLSFDRSGHKPRRQILSPPPFHPPPLLLLLLLVLWLSRQSWCSFSAWMLTLIHSLLSCIRWTPVSVVLLDGKLALVALWSLPLLLPRHPRMMMTPTTMIMMRMEMLALPVLTRCLLDTFTLYHSWQRGKVVLDMRVIILVVEG